MYRDGPLCTLSFYWFPFFLQFYTYISAGPAGSSWRRLVLCLERQCQLVGPLCLFEGTNWKDPRTDPSGYLRYVRVLLQARLMAHLSVGLYYVGSPQST